MGQGKKWSQMKDSETFAFISLIAAIIMLLLILLASCNVKAQTETIPDDDERIWIHMSDGDSIELIADEYGNQYLKENAGSVYIYIPYPGTTEESDTLHFYNAKN